MDGDHRPTTSISRGPVHVARELLRRSACFELPQPRGDLLGRRAVRRGRREVRRDGDLRMGPERVLGRQGLDAEDVERRARQLPIVERRQQIFIDDRAASPDIDHVPAARHLRKRAAIEQILRLRRERQCVDQGIGAREKGVEPTPRFMETVNAAVKEIGVPKDRFKTEAYG